MTSRHRCRRAGLAIMLLVLPSAAGLDFGSRALGGEATPLPLHRGVNTFPWIYRARTTAEAGKVFDYDRLFPYFDAYRPAHFASLQKAGVDFVRAIVEPSPFLAADARMRASLVDLVLLETRKASDLGLTVVVDLHPRETVQAWKSLAILSDPEMKDRYEATLLDFARALTRPGHGRYALELMNEPPGGYGWRDNYGWLDFQTRLVKSIRAVAPDLPLVVTGDRGGGIDGLLRLDPAVVEDPAIIYSFHYYEPMAVSHQGATWTSKAWRRYMDAVPYPPAPELQEPTLTHVRDAILGDPSLDPAAAQKIWEESRAVLVDYFAGHRGADSIAADFARVDAWAKAHHIPAARILLGEFGVYRPGATLPTAVAYTRDVRVAAEDKGYAWAFFNYTPSDDSPRSYSLLKMSGATPNAFDPDMMQTALGLDLP